MELLLNVGTYEGMLLGFKSDGSIDEFQTEYSFGASTSSLKALYQYGRYLFVSGYEEIIKVFDVRRKKELTLLEQHSGTINVMKGHENYVISGGDDGKICIWKSKQWDLVHKFDAESSVVDMCIHPTGRILITSTKDNKVQFWNLMNLKRILIKKFNFNIQKIRMFQQGEEVSHLIMLSDRKLYIVNCETNKVCHSIPFEHGLTDIIVKDTSVIISDQSGYVSLLQLNFTDNTHTIVMKFQAHQQRVKQMQLLDFNDTSYICTISTNGEIKLWDTLQYVDEQYTEIDLANNLKPIYDINTKHRLTCISLVSMSTIENAPKTAAEGEQTQDAAKVNSKKHKKNVSKLKNKQIKNAAKQLLLQNKPKAQGDVTTINKKIQKKINKKNKKQALQASSEQPPHKSTKPVHKPVQQPTVPQQAKKVKAQK